MQPSPVEIQREVEALRDIRRRSTSQGGPGSLVLDPDLPVESSPTSPSAGYWTSGTNPGLTDGDSSSSSHEDSSSSEQSSSSDDPFHLFWVPARLHPEIAPTEFRAFLKEHARNPPADSGGGLSRSASAASASSSGLGRRTSMLSRQYRPTESDGSDDEQVLPLRRNRSSIYHPGPQLTINDLQKLDQLAEEASSNDDPTKLRSILRRSLSLNVSPSVVDTMDNMPDPGEDADAPIIVPRPGQILRRAARTKIRKPGLPGDGGGHRFGQSTRRQAAGNGRTAPTIDPRNSGDMSSSDHSEPLESSRRGRVFSGESFTDELRRSPPLRPDSYSEEASSIFDSYVREDPDDDESRTVASSPVPVDYRTSRVVVTSPPSPPPIEIPSSSPPPQPKSEPIPIPIPPAPSIIHQPQPQRVATLRPPTQEYTRTTSPDSLRSAEGAAISRSLSPGSETSSLISTSPNSKKEKDKKGLFSFGRDKSSRKGGKEKERDKEQRERVEREKEEEKKKEKEKESGFFGSLFGGKKKQDEASAQSGSGAGREAAAAFGASKSSKSYVPTISPQFVATDGSYARYPIHVERAIYRLSHIKLANPRRPLYEQVLISNLMFWYLGVINKTPSPESTESTPSLQTQQQQAGNSSAADREAREREQQEAEERQRAEKEKESLEKEREREREREREQQQKKEAAPRRGSLTRNASAGAPAGRRAAEMPVRGPQYEMQHRVMEQAYGGLGAGPSSPMPARSNTTAVSISGGPPRPGQPQSADGYSNSGGKQQRPPQLQLPPGAMAPMSSEQMSWLSSSTATSPSPPPQPVRPSTPPSSPPTAPAIPGVSEAYPAARRSRSPPQHNQNRFAPSPIHMPDLYIPPTPVAGNSNSIAPSRSRSATATTAPTQPPVQPNGKLRKNMSAQAVMANGRKPRRSDPAPTSPTGEEEDVPLALWQQRQRR